MTATRVHRALRTEDLLACVLSQLDVADGCKQRLVSVCTVWRDAWRRCCKDKYRAMRLHVGDLDHCDYAVTSPNGVIVSDYGHSRLVEYSSHGSERAVYCQKFRDPNALICCGDGTAWVACARDSSNCWRLVRVKLGRCHPDGPLWPNDGWQSPSDDSRVLQLIVLRESHLDFPRGLALSDDNKLLVLNVGTKSSPAERNRVGQVDVFDAATGAALYSFGQATSSDGLRDPRGMAVSGDLCFVCDTWNQLVKIFNWRTRELVKIIGSRAVGPPWADNPGPGEEYAYWNIDYNYTDARKSVAPGEFCEPFDVAFRDGKLYVSEYGGRRIQILKLSDDIRGPVECLQIIPAPDGGTERGRCKLTGLCLDANNRLWCTGRSAVEEYPEGTFPTCLHIYTPFGY